MFESVSGFSTTGSSVIADPGEVPAGVLIWRAITQWMGGLGLVLLVVATMKRLNAGSLRLYDAEFSGTQQRKLHPHIARSVSRMWQTYTLITIILIVLLRVVGNTGIDSVCLALSTVSTGGFMTSATGLAGYPDSTLAIMTIFMFLSGVNVALLYNLFTLRWRQLRRTDELGVYFIIYFVAVVLCTVSFYSSSQLPVASAQLPVASNQLPVASNQLPVASAQFPVASSTIQQINNSHFTVHSSQFTVHRSPITVQQFNNSLNQQFNNSQLPHSFCYSLFHVASTVSTCGFYTEPPAVWPFLPSAVTFLLILCGAMAGSTGGGIKLRRLMTLGLYLRNYFTRMMHPEAVFTIKIDRKVVPSEYVHKIFGFVFLYICFIVGGAFLLTLGGSSIAEAFCMAAANISNLGPSPLINTLGASLDYAALPDLSKWTLMILMLAGRLEIFALLAIFTPAYWKKR